MPDIIHLLSDSVANQIAAGEVIQRPASIVKELMENSVDAGASSITVHVKDAGKTMVQVIDDGSGMSENDARMSFERHATSKISEAGDLFAIRTMGFRGEALASIAAVSEVTLRTRRAEEELGTEIRIGGSRLREQIPVSCPAGSNFQVRNLFFNVPARRKFLKSDQTELRHIITEFTHVALTHTAIEFILIHNNTEIYRLPASNLRQRIVGLFGKSSSQYILPLSLETSLVKITGFIGKPEYAKKTFGEQFFFVNNRFMRHPYFHRAVIKAYENILAPDHIPAYFIYFGTDPGRIDINIHPTKTEIKFEDEQAVWQILLAGVKEAIGKHNLSPSLDFSREGVIDIPVLTRDSEIKNPEIDINHDFNPFAGEVTYNRNRTEGWEKLFRARSGEKEHSAPDFETGETAAEPAGTKYIQILNRYILAPVKSGFMIIDQHRASERILYETIIRSLRKNAQIIQQTLFPVTIELSPADYQVFEEISPSIEKLGFDIRAFGHNSIIIHGTPGFLLPGNLKDTIETLLEQYKNLQDEIEIDELNRLARSAASASAIPYGQKLFEQEMREMVDQLFGCEHPDYSPSGEVVAKIISREDIENLLKEV
ncbi:MAG: DNA mismatch repair endonuclease MutL [Bacteroidales bacterium]|nr:DNA mismatch repair endonuclease MutL [Bacteroidales bacterium]